LVSSSNQNDKSIPSILEHEVKVNIFEHLEHGEKTARRRVALGEDVNRMLRSPEPPLSNNHNCKGISERI
jgi:hypothetical protein